MVLNDLNEVFLEFDKLCENLNKENELNTKNKNYVKRVIETNNFSNELYYYTFLFQKKLKPISYTESTNLLINKFIQDEWFQTKGLSLRTLEKGVINPVLHYCQIQNKNYYENKIEFLELNKFGSDYNLYQGVYEELNLIEIPVIKFSLKKKELILSTNSQNQKDFIEKNFNEIQQKLEKNLYEEKKKVFINSDCSTSDSGYVSLNTTDIDYENDNEINIQENSSKKKFNGSFNNSIESINSLSSEISTNNINTKNDTTEFDIKKCTNKYTGNNKNINYIKKKFTLSTKEIIINTKKNDLNDGHLIIGFKIKETFFKKVFEENWFDLTAARLFSSNVAARFGLKNIKFLRQIATNIEHKNKIDDGILYNYILHAEFKNLNSKNKVFFLDFVHRLRLKTIGSVTLYTNVNKI